MECDFNQAGIQYDYLAMSEEPGHYQMLSKKGAIFFEDLQKHLCEKWANDLQSPELKRWLATIDCLSSFLYQSKRLARHSEELNRHIPPLNQMLAHSGKEALADFETLLYLGRSALDRLAFAIAKQTYGQDVEKYDKLKNILGNYKKKEKRAEHAIQVIETSLDTFQSILINHKDGKTGLRSLLAHSRSTGESLTHVFTVHRITDGKVLRFDLELERNGVLNTSWILNQKVSFTILNLVALYSGFRETVNLNLMDCKPTWSPQCVCLSSFIDSTRKGKQISTIRTNAYGYEIINHHVRKELFAQAQKV